MFAPSLRFLRTLAFLPLPLLAAPGDLVESSAPPLVPPGNTLSAARQGDGKWFVGSTIFSFGSPTPTNLVVAGETRGTLVRLNPDLSLDETFFDSAIRSVRALEPGPNGTLYVLSTVASDSPVDPFVTRLLPSGAPDPAFDSAVKRLTTAIRTDPQGRLLVAGFFTVTHGGQTVNSVARLMPNGSLDSGFSTQIDGLVSRLTLQDDGKILICGNFTSISGISRRLVARLHQDGSLDESFDAGANFAADGSAAFAVQSWDGSIFVSGRFLHDGVSTQGIIRLNSDGSRDPGFLTTTAAMPQGAVVLANGGLVIPAVSLASAPDNAWRTVDRTGSLIRSWASTTNTITGAILPAGGNVLFAAGRFGSPLRAATYAENDPGEGSLELDSATGTLQWTRSGADPALERVRFEILGSEGNWTPLPAPVRDGQTWTLQITDLPDHGAIRATGEALHTWASSRVSQTLTFGETAASLVRTDAAGAPAGGPANLGTTPPMIPSRLPLYIANAGNGIAAGLSASIAGPHAADFTLRTLPPGFLDPASSVQLSVEFRPTANGAREATLTIIAADSPEAEPVEIPLTGHGLIALDPSFASPATVPFTVGPFDRTYQVGSNDLHLDGMTVGTINLGFAPEARVILTLFDAGNSLIKSPLADLANHQFVDAVHEGQTYRFQAFYTTDSKKILLYHSGPGAIDTRFRGSSHFAMTMDRSGILWGSSGSSIFRSNAATGQTLGAPIMGFTNIQSLCALADGSLLVGGQFLPQVNRPQSHLAKVLPGGAIDPDFAPQFNARVQAVLPDPQGRILAAGNFTEVEGSQVPRLVRLMGDGSFDASFDASGAAPNGEVTRMALLRDGGIVISGSFTSLGGAPRNGLGRLGENGALDTSFAPTPNAGGTINVITEDAFGRILIGGSFTSVGEQPRPYLARLHPDGTVDSAFNPDVPGPVVSLSTDTSGRVVFLLGGSGSDGRFFRVREDGSLDPEFVTDSNPQSGRTTLPAPDGSIYVSSGSGFLGPWSANALRFLGGSAGSALEAMEGGGVRWTSEGAFPTVGAISFSEVSTGGVSPISLGNGIMTGTGVWELPVATVQSPSYIKAKMWIPGSRGGYYHEAGYAVGPASPQLAAFTASGTPVEQIHVGSILPGYETVVTRRIYNTGNTVLEGLSALFPPDATGFLSVLSPPPAVLAPGDWFELKLGFSSPVAGAFASVVTIGNGTPHLEIPVTASSSLTPLITLTEQGMVPMISSDGMIPAGADVSLALGFHPPTGTQITLFDNLSASPISGNFPSLQQNSIIHLEHGGQSHSFVVGYRGGTGNDLVLTLLGPGTADPGFVSTASGIWSLTRQPDGRILAGGWASLHGGLSRILPDGSRDPTFKRPSFNGGRVECIRVLPDGRIMICGQFTQINGVTRNHIARLLPDGSLDHSFNANAVITGSGSQIVNRMLIDAQGRIIIGGSGWGTTRRLLPNGAADASFTSYNLAQVKSLLALPDGGFLSGGLAANIDKHLPNGQFDNTFSTSVGPSGGEGSRCYGMLYEQHADGDRIVISGAFTTVNGTARSRVARLLPNGALDPTFVPPPIDGVVACILRQTDGKYIISGYFSNVGTARRIGIARLMPDGSLDTSFIPSLVSGGGDHLYTSLILEDGSILGGGNFPSASGLASTSGLARLFNEPAVNNLSVSPGNDVNWTRGGTAPDLRSAAFHYTANGGATWVPMPSASRSADAWTLPNASLPAEGILRAEGIYQQGPRSWGTVHSFTVFGRDPTPAELWRNLHFRTYLPVGLAADHSDPDGDGVSNFMERAFGLDPWNGKSRELPAWSFQEEQMSLRFNRPEASANFRYTGEWSATLLEGDWHPIPNSAAEGFEFLLPSHLGGNAFGRLRVDEN